MSTENRRERIYLAGPMTGLPELNHPAFNAEAARLRALGFEVVSPAEINPNGGSWEWCMRRDIAQLVTCDTVALLPGWAKSRGANIERQVAAEIGMNVVMAYTITEDRDVAACDGAMTYTPKPVVNAHDLVSMEIAG